MNIAVPLAEGFEEIEAVAVIDILRRAGINVTTAFIKSNPVTGSHNIPVTADADFSTLSPSEFDGIVLPGGMPGSRHLKEDPRVIDFIRAVYSRNGYTAALCAAPTVLYHAGILKGRRVTVFPEYAASMPDAAVTGDSVVIDERIITGKGAGAAIDFALALVSEMAGSDKAKKLRASMQVFWNE